MSNATRLGVGAVKALNDGEAGVVVGLHRSEVARTPLADVADRTKPIKTELLDLARVLAK